MNLFNIFGMKRVPTSEEYYNKIIKIKEKNCYSYEKAYANQEETLYKIYGEANKIDKKIKIIIVTDTHNSLNEENFKSFIEEHSSYDVCLLLGDFSNNDIRTILNYIDKSKTYALLGNHDYNYINEYGFNDLNGNMININGVTLLGIQGSFKYKPSNFPSFSQKDSLLFLKDKPPVDIFVSHDMGFNSNAERDPAHQGLFGITYYLFKNKIPYHIHGHIHESYKNTMINGTVEISSYMFEFIEL